ncbi:sensor histidine kinase [Actomonas aquatica]|uniref:histidine kinase n=1 Tax=Actomonas aquatica TaxID=2866162 RepID=A0ABZ1C504_9BACT|nr:ATP-binding protein [Opitutus sp. WL0086]WRQ86477.1 ATP-binding protein [Opitutus sp. WL0086]
MIRTFTFRTTLWFAGLVTGILVAVLAVGGWLLNRQMIAGLELLHEVEAEELGELLGSDGALSAAEIQDRIAHDADSDAELFFIQVRGRDGVVRFRSDNLEEAVLPDWSQRGVHWTYQLPGVGPVRVTSMTEGPWHLQLASRLEPNRRVLNDYLRVAGLLVLGGALVSVGLGWGFTRVTLAPIRSIERTARRIGADNLSERIPVPAGRDELAALSRLLNETFARIEAAFGQVRRFTADASHELKTPLALIKLNAEKLRPHLADDEEGEATLNNVLEEIERLHQIIEHLLFLSKAESGVLRLEYEALRMPDWLRDWEEDAGVLAEDVGVRFELVEEGAATVRGVPSLLRQLLFNLLSNALKFSEAGGRVTLRVQVRGGRCWWSLEDEGPGLPEDQLARVFDRFARYVPSAGNGRADSDVEAKPGHGLGLAICKSIVELHGGVIRAENRRERKGLRVVVELPVVG